MRLWLLAEITLGSLLVFNVYPIGRAAEPRSDQRDVGASSAMQYTNEPLIRLLAKYSRDDGEAVDYAAWKDSPGDLAVLKQQVALIAAISPDNHPEQFATPTAVKSYWINSYNTLVLNAVLELWPLESVREVKLSFSSRLVPGKGFFYDREVVVGGETTNLYDLEKKLLRQQRDPRIHFALNCASNSCPALRSTQWSEDELELAARAFVNTPENLRIDKRSVKLSRIFKWYKKQFPDDILAYLEQYADEPLRAQLQTAREQHYRIGYLDYDWDLNSGDSDQSTPANGH